MIEVHCEGQGSLKLREKNPIKGNYVSKLHSTFGGAKLKSPLARDLLRVGQATFLADRAFRRGERLGQQTRRLTVSVPVEEPARWTSIRDRVIRLAEFVSQDKWRFEFTQLGGRHRQRARLEAPAVNASVSLFSNGLDSLCGAAAAFRRGETPIFVTQSPPGVEHVKRKIDTLQEALGFQQVQPQFMNVYFRASDRDARGKRNMFPERTRRTRPMLFLSIAGAAALELGVSRIYLNENGVLAINLPLKADRHGPQITRHAHPETLRRFESLLQALWPFDSQPSVCNPFFGMTKADEIKHLRHAAQLAEETITCEYAGQQIATLIKWLKRNNRPYRKTRECGLCVPCLVRRSAMETAGILERAGHYVFDARRAFNNPKAYVSAPLYNHISGYVRDLYEFSAKIEKMKPSEFVLCYLCELSLLPSSTEDVNQSARATYKLYKRFAQQFVYYLRV